MTKHLSLSCSNGALCSMIYEKFPQLHSLSAEDKATLAKELLQEAAKTETSIPKPFLGRDPARLQKLEPEWKNKIRNAQH